MTRVIISDHKRKQLVQLQNAANVTWRKALNSQGFCSFDLPFSDPFCTPSYINPSNFIHVFSDTADSTNFATADWGGALVNDYELKPNDGVITIAAAGLANLLETSIVSATTSFNGLDVGSVMNNLIVNCDNFAALGLTAYTVSTQGPPVTNYVAAFGDSVLEDIYKLCADYGMDFEVRPDFSYAIYHRQGVDRPDLVARYGEQGNVQVDSKMNLVNTELGNRVYFVDNSGNQVFVASQTSVTYYGPKTVVVQDGDTFTSEDALTKAQLYALRSAFPLFMLDKVAIVNTALLPFSDVEIGDRILFEAPSLPMLKAFNGLQRILSAEYNDRVQTITFTLGNALYKMVKGRIHEVRLYDSNNTPFVGNNPQ